MALIRLRRQIVRLGSPTGVMTDLVSVLRQVKTSDLQGGHTVTWVDLVTSGATLTRFWASIRPLTAQESLAAAAINATISYVVTMRYRADVDETMRVQWTPYRATTAKTLEIHGVLPLDGGRAFIALQCSET